MPTHFNCPSRPCRKSSFPVRGVHSVIRRSSYLKKFPAPLASPPVLPSSSVPPSFHGSSVSARSGARLVARHRRSRPRWCVPPRSGPHPGFAPPFYRVRSVIRQSPYLKEFPAPLASPPVLPSSSVPPSFQGVRQSRSNRGLASSLAAAASRPGWRVSLRPGPTLVSHCRATAPLPAPSRRPPASRARSSRCHPPCRKKEKKKKKRNQERETKFVHDDAPPRYSMPTAATT